MTSISAQIIVEVYNGVIAGSRRSIGDKLTLAIMNGMLTKMGIRVQPSIIRGAVFEHFFYEPNNGIWPNDITSRKN